MVPPAQQASVAKDQKPETEFAKAFIEPPDNAAEQQAATAFWDKYVHQPPMRLFFAGILAGGTVVTVLWLLLHFLMFKKAGKQRTAQDGEQEMQSRRESLNQIKDACLSSGSAEQVKQALLDFGRTLWFQKPPLTLSELAERFGDPTLKDQLEKLNQALYSGNMSVWNAKEFWNVFKSVEQQGKKRGKDEQDPVPPLYPN